MFLAEAQGSIVAFQRVPEPKSGKNRVHLDVRSRTSGRPPTRSSSSAARGTGTSGRSTRLDGAPLQDLEGNEFDIYVTGE